MNFCYVLLVLFIVKAALVFEETKSSDAKIEKSIQSSSDSTEVIPLVHCIFDEPFLDLICGFLPFPHYIHCVVNRDIRDHFQKDHFSCWHVFAKTLDIPGLVPTYDLIWFHKVSDFFSDALLREQMYISSLSYALVHKNLFAFNYRPICKYIVSKSNGSYFSGFREFLIEFNEFDILADILASGPNDMFEDNFDKVDQWKNCLRPLFESLKSHPKFEYAYRNLLNQILSSSRLEFLFKVEYFLAMSIISEIPSDFFFHRLDFFLSSETFISHVFSFVCSIAEDFEVSSVLVINRNLFEKLAQNCSTKFLDYLILLNETRFGSNNSISFSKVSGWTIDRLDMFSEACILAGKVDLFNYMWNRRFLWMYVFRIHIIEGFIWNIIHNGTIMSPKYFLHMLSKIDFANHKQLIHCKGFHSLLSMYYDLIEIEKPSENVISYLFSASIDHSEHSIPERFRIDWEVPVNTYSSNYVFCFARSHIFKSSESLALLAHQVSKFPLLMNSLNKGKISAEQYKMISKIEDDELKKLFRSKVKCEKFKYNDKAIFDGISIGWV
jgi:hypothetical protein